MGGCGRRATSGGGRDCGASQAYRTAVEAVHGYRVGLREALATRSPRGLGLGSSVAPPPAIRGRTYVVHAHARRGGGATVVGADLAAPPTRAPVTARGAWSRLAGPRSWSVSARVRIYDSGRAQRRRAAPTLGTPVPPRWRGRERPWRHGPTTHTPRSGSARNTCARIYPRDLTYVLCSMFYLG